MSDWIGTREASAQLGVTLRTLYRFIDQGRLPAYKMGRVIRLQAADVANFSRHGLDHSGEIGGALSRATWSWCRSDRRTGAQASLALSAVGHPKPSLAGIVTGGPA